MCGPMSAIAPWLAICAQLVPPVRNMSGGVPDASIALSFASYSVVRLVTSTLRLGTFPLKASITGVTTAPSAALWLPRYMMDVPGGMLAGPAAAPPELADVPHAASAPVAERVSDEASRVRRVCDLISSFLSQRLTNALRSRCAGARLFLQRGTRYSRIPLRSTAYSFAVPAPPLAITNARLLSPGDPIDSERRVTVLTQDGRISAIRE